MPETDTTAAARLNQARNADQAATAKTETKNEDAQQSQIGSAEFLLVGLLAMAKDFLIDPISTISIIGLPSMIFFNIPMAGFLWLWCLIRFKKTPHGKLAGTTILETFFGFLPFWTGLIAYLWMEQNGFLPKWLTRLGKTKK